MLFIFKDYVEVSHANMVVPVMRIKSLIYVAALNLLVVTIVKVHATVPIFNVHCIIPQRITPG